MYDLSLTAEQREFRAAVRDFVAGEVAPAALQPARLERFERPLLLGVLDRASGMGLRTLMLPEEVGGAGADCLTACLVMEELAAGDVDVATVLAHTAALAHLVFERAMTDAQRARWLPEFLDDERAHLARVGRRPGAGAGWSYHGPDAEPDAGRPAAVRRDGGYVLDGAVPFVANAPLAKFFVVEARADASAPVTLLVPRDSAGLTIGAPLSALGETIRWHHGSGAGVVFRDCRVPEDHRLAAGAGDADALSIVPLTAALNLGVGRAAYRAAVEYARLRRQGGRSIIEHQAIGSKLADCAIRLELARALIWKAAWALDHPDAAASADDDELALPLHTMARVYTASAVNEVALLAAECFGAMGVMRDMPLQKYVHDSMVFLHAEDADEATKLGIAEAIAGYRRPLAAA